MVFVNIKQKKNTLKVFGKLETKKQMQQQNEFVYTKWFHWILSEFISPSERDLTGMKWWD